MFAHLIHNKSICIGTSRIIRAYWSFSGILLEVPWNFNVIIRWFHCLFGKSHILVDKFIFMIHQLEPPRLEQLPGSTRIHHVDPPESIRIHHWDPWRSTTGIHDWDPPGSTTGIQQDPQLGSPRNYKVDLPQNSGYFLKNFLWVQTFSGN